MKRFMIFSCFYSVLQIHAMPYMCFVSFSCLTNVSLLVSRAESKARLKKKINQKLTSIMKFFITPSLYWGHWSGISWSAGIIEWWCTICTNANPPMPPFPGPGSALITFIIRNINTIVSIIITLLKIILPHQCCFRIQERTNYWLP